MADITRLGRFVDGIGRSLDISANTLVTQSIKVGGGVSNTELTKAILDNLVTLQNGSDVSASLHHHDGRYRTESELSESQPTSSGARLVGVDEKTYPNMGLGSAVDRTAQQLFDAIETALGTAAGSSFSDAEFEVTDNLDATKILMLQLSAIATGTTRTLSMPDSDVNLQHLLDLITLSGVAGGSTSLGTFTGSTIADNRTIKQALQDLETAIDAAAAGLIYRGSLAAGSDLTGNLTGNAYLDGGSGLSTGDLFKISSDGNITVSDGTIAVNTGDMLIANKDVASDAAIVIADLDKIDNTESADLLREGDLASAQIFVGSAGGIATARTVTGDVLISNTGVTAIQSGVVTNAMLAGSIATSKLVDAATVTEAKSFFDATDISGAEAETLTSGANADSLHEHGKTFISKTAAEDIDAGEVVCLNASGEAALAVASDLTESSAVIGVAVTTATTGNPVKIQLTGEVTVSVLAGDGNLEAGRVYLSKTAGQVTQDVSGFVSGDTVVMMGKRSGNAAIILGSMDIVYTVE